MVWYQTGSQSFERFFEEEVGQDRRLQQRRSIDQEQALREQVSEVQRGTDFSQQQTERLLSELPSYIYRQSRDNAIGDAQGAVDRALTNILNRDLPELRANATASGAYNDVTQNLLRDNLLAQAAGEAGALEAENLREYSQMQLGGIESAIRALELAQGQQVAAVSADASVAQRQGAEDILDESERYRAQGHTRIGQGVTTSAAGY